MNSSRNRLRLWILVIALGLVLAAMRQLGKPSTARRLEKLFTNPPANVATSIEDTVVSKTSDPHLDTIVSNVEVAEAESSRETPPSSVPSDNAIVEGFSSIKDNTYFRPEEQLAWFGFFELLQNADMSQLLEDSFGHLTYAQLLQQPEVYRGRIVTINGAVVREEKVRPAENQLGIDSYHRLTVQPQGGGQWPMVVYCLKLPSEFPRGDNLYAQVSASGYFFKNWSYSHQDGLGLAPIILTKELQWQAPVEIARKKSASPREWLFGAMIASCIALVCTWIAIRYTRRRPRLSGGTEEMLDLANLEQDQ